MLISLILLLLLFTSKMATFALARAATGRPRDLAISGRFLASLHYLYTSRLAPAWPRPGPYLDYYQDASFAIFY